MKMKVLLILNMIFTVPVYSKGTRLSKVGCVFPMVIGSEFCIVQYSDGDHREDVPHFILA